jgi:hypothetical protein
VPSNQLLRPYDNVPRTALAQDVTGNRIVYANYLQNYNLKTVNNKNYTPSFSVSWANFDNFLFFDDGLESVKAQPITTDTLKSIKSLREYQLGVVFTDIYGRETPVVSNNQAILKLEKQRADKANKIKVGLKNFNSKPIDLTHMKFYVKETAGEYYNMAMDRFYDAEDNNVWLAFPSSDRNKVDIDTFLILKKGSDQDTLVSEAARYKILAIENEAPDFIKTSKILAANITHSTTGKDLFTTSPDSLPILGRNEFKMAYSPWSNGPGRNLDAVRDAELYVEFQIGGQRSDRYRISSIANDFVIDQAGSNLTASRYSIQLEDVLGNDINANLGTTGGATSTTTTITLTAADLPQHNHSIPALAVQVNTGVPATLNIPGVGTTQPNQNGVAGDPANVAHLHRGFGNSASQPAAVALFKRFYAYAAGVCPAPDPPLAGPDVAEGTIYCGYYCGGAIQAAYTGAASMDNSIQWTGGIYTGGGATALDSHLHSTVAQTVNLPSLVGSTATGTTGDTGTAPPIIITSGSIAIIPPYTKLYYIQRTA